MSKKTNTCDFNLHIYSKTWNKESNELFDYDNEKQNKEYFEINSRKLVFRKGESILVVKPTPFKEDKADLICKIDNDSRNFYLISNIYNKYNSARRKQEDFSVVNEYNTPFFESGANNIWYVVKNNYNERVYNNSEGNNKFANNHKLIVGDIIKIGRMKMKIIEIKLNQSEDSSDNENKQENNRPFSDINEVRRRSTNMAYIINNNEDNEENNNNEDNNNDVNYLETVSVNNNTANINNNHMNNNNNNINYNSTGVNFIRNFNNDNNGVVVNDNNQEELNNINNINNPNYENYKIDNIDEVLAKAKDFNKDKKSSKKLCRICYCTEEEMNSTLIQPCDCSGSMRYIHFSCLQSWLKSRSANIKKSSSSNAAAYFFKNNLDCELCKKIIPDRIRQKNKVYNILEFLNSDFQSYIILESFLSNSDKRNYPEARQFYSVKLDGKTNFKLGRGHESDLRFNDISISRIHAQFNVLTNDSGEKDYVTISDCDSKFGTLVYSFNSRLPIIRNLPLSVQIGKSVLLFTIKKPLTLYSLLCCCCTTNKKDKTDRYSNYQEVNSSMIHILNQQSYHRIKSISFNDETEDEPSNIKSKNLGITELNSNVNINANNNIVLTSNYQDNNDNNTNNINLEENNSNNSHSENKENTIRRHLNGEDIERSNERIVHVISKTMNVNTKLETGNSNNRENSTSNPKINIELNEIKEIKINEDNEIEVAKNIGENNKEEEDPNTIIKSNINDDVLNNKDKEDKIEKQALPDINNVVKSLKTNNISKTIISKQKPSNDKLIKAKNAVRVFIDDSENNNTEENNNNSNNNDNVVIKTNQEVVKNNDNEYLYKDDNKDEKEKNTTENKNNMDKIDIEIIKEKIPPFKINTNFISKKDSIISNRSNKSYKNSENIEIKDNYSNLKELNTLRSSLSPINKAENKLISSITDKEYLEYQPIETMTKHSSLKTLSKNVTQHSKINPKMKVKSSKNNVISVDKSIKDDKSLKNSLNSNLTGKLLSKFNKTKTLKNSDVLKDSEPTSPIVNNIKHLKKKRENSINNNNKKTFKNDNMKHKNETESKNNLNPDNSDKNYTNSYFNYQPYEYNKIKTKEESNSINNIIKSVLSHSKTTAKLDNESNLKTKSSNKDYRLSDNLLNKEISKEKKKKKRSKRNKSNELLQENSNSNNSNNFNFNYANIEKLNTIDENALLNELKSESRIEYDYEINNNQESENNYKSPDNNPINSINERAVRRKINKESSQSLSKGNSSNKRINFSNNIRQRNESDNTLPLNCSITNNLNFNFTNEPNKKDNDEESKDIL